MTEITTANATSVYVDTFIDPNLYKPQNRARNRRLLFLLSLVGGSFAGAEAYKRYGSAYTLLISAVAKTFVTAGFFFNREEAEEDNEKISQGNFSKDTFDIV